MRVANRAVGTLSLPNAWKLKDRPKDCKEGKRGKVRRRAEANPDKIALNIES